MSSFDNQEPDMMLVSSYIPVFIMMLKSSGVVMVSYILNVAGLREKIKLLAFSTIAYIDIHRRLQGGIDRSAERSVERACGFLVFVLAAALLNVSESEALFQTPYACQLSFNAMSWLAGLLWAIMSTSVCCLCLFNVTTNISLVHVLLSSCVLLSLHISSVCADMPTLELLFRTLTFVCMCSMMFFAKRFTNKLDRNLYMSVIPFLCAHVLFVKLEIAVPSLLAWTGLIAWVFYRNQPHCGDGPSLPRRTATATDSHFEPDEEAPEITKLMSQLRAAKAQTQE